jgi:hypothetical protein
MMIGTGIAAQVLTAGSACVLAANTKVEAYTDADGEGGARRTPLLDGKGFTSPLRSAPLPAVGLAPHQSQSHR